MTLATTTEAVWRRAAANSTFSFSSESVAAGHPDKICDQISDAILDALLADDPRPANVRCAIETLATRDYLLSRADLEALVPVVQGQMTLLVGVNRASDIREVPAFAAE